ncbi:MAG TPA: mercuric transporter MerT family protein [Caldilineaceae bacterium]|mgnify:CR=1 FL=1|jgi:hypothetical protein|nr:mercuric transporter MerT family protein [Caldilineaceae bacterium]
MNNSRLGSVISPLAAALSASCCVLPIGLLLLGFTSLGPFVFLMRYRWLTLGFSVLMLVAAFYAVYRPQAKIACANGLCSPQALRHQRLIVWLSAVLMVVFYIVGEMLPVSMTM